MKQRKLHMAMLSHCSVEENTVRWSPGRMLLGIKKKNILDHETGSA